MLTYPEFDPIALQLGPLAIRWYGLMYLVGFGGAWWLGRRRAQRPDSGWQPSQVEDVIFWGALGVILGGRVGYVLFYGLDNFLKEPLSLFYVWQGGMSFHGGLLGVIIALWWYARRHQRHPFDVIDFIAPLVPIGLATGRLGNFVNGELWGRKSDLPWAMVFPKAGAEPRHPSQLYEFMLEGVLLFLVLWWFSGRSRPRYAISGLFAIGYGVFRFLVEFVRQPDAHLDYVAFHWMTMGQLLSLPLLVVGVLLLWLAYGRRRIAA